MATIGKTLRRDAGASIVQRRFRMVMILGTLTSVCNFVDRSILNILAEPIKRELSFSDTQLGLLTGFAFALFYSIVALPIARYVDRPTADRPSVIAICMILWSAMTIACGAVTTYGQLLGARVLVAVGESGAGPAVVTLIDEYVPAHRRSRAFAIYGLGVPVGMLLGLVVGGVIVDHLGWRLAFAFVGAPGLLLAACVRLFMHEPRRAAPRSSGADTSPTIRDTLHVIVQSSGLRWILAANALSGFYAVGLPSWSGVYLIRLLHLTPMRAGLVLGLVIGVGGGIGTLLGGALGDRFSARDPGRALLAPALGLAVVIPSSMAALMASDWRIFAAFYLVTACGAAAYIGPLVSLVQRLAGARHRASVVVIGVMLFNVVGAGIGPLLIGFGSDLLLPAYGPAGLRWAMMVGYATAAVAALMWLRAMSLVSDELRTASDAEHVATARVIA